MYLLAVVPVSASHTMTCTPQRIRREKRLCALHDRDPFRPPGITWPATSAHLYVLAAADRIGSLVHVHNIVRSLTTFWLLTPEQFDAIGATWNRCAPGRGARGGGLCGSKRCGVDMR